MIHQSVGHHKSVKYWRTPCLLPYAEHFHNQNFFHVQCTFLLFFCLFFANLLTAVQVIITEWPHCTRGWNHCQVPLIWLWCNGGHQTCKRCSTMLRMYKVNIGIYVRNTIAAVEGRPVRIALSILNIKQGLHVWLAGGAPVLLLPLRGPHHHLLHPLQHAQVLRAPGEL